MPAKDKECREQKWVWSAFRWFCWSDVCERREGRRRAGLEKPQSASSSSSQAGHLRAQEQR